MAAHRRSPQTETRLDTLATKAKRLKEALVEQLTRMPIVEAACKHAGVGRSTYYKWRKDDKEFSAAADKALESGSTFINDVAESKLIQLINNGNTTAIIFWLKNHHHMYNDRIRHEHEHHFGSEITKEQAEEIIRAFHTAVGMRVDENQIQRERHFLQLSGDTSKTEKTVSIKDALKRKPKN